MLYLVATPIGNLKDLSLRAQEILSSVDSILCEDTRTSAVLLNHYHLKKTLKAYHKFNESQMLPSVIEDLASGKSLALISDAGTPGISDPGEILVEHVIEKGFLVRAIPGPTALISALILSGFKTTPFQFLGFLPKKSGELRKAVNELLTYPGTSVVYESPHRLLKLLKCLPQEKEVSVSRELTKKFEETRRGKVSDILKHFEDTPPRGEFVVVIKEGQETSAPPPTLEEAAEILRKQGLSKGAFLKTLSQQFQMQKKEILKILEKR